MAPGNHFTLLILVLVLPMDCSQTQTQTLLKIRRLLSYPPILSTWNSSTPDLCNTEMIVCYEGTITQLHVIGKEEGNSMLPPNFSIHSLVTTLALLPDLKVLTLVSLGLWGPFPTNITALSSLEILNLTSNFLYGPIPPSLSALTTLQALALDANMLSGHLPDSIGSLTSLRVLSLRRNVFNSSLPDSLTQLQNLRVLRLSHNHFYGRVPDLSGSKNLQVLHLEDNHLGPQFPKLGGTQLVSLVLSNNRFRSALPPPEILTSSQYQQLQRLDLSFNKLVGPFPPSLLSLPSITSLNIADNQLTGMLLQNTSCSPQLELVDLSSNLLTGHLPDCLIIMSESGDKKKTVRFAHNCLMNGGINQDQNLPQSCQNGALAVGIIPPKERASKSFGVALALAGGVLGGLALVATLFFLLGTRLNNADTLKPPTRLIAEKASTDVYSSKLFTDARYISQTTKLMGALGLPAYRTFTLEELEEATNNFDSSTFMGEGSQGQMYRGKLKDGSMVAIRCLKMKKRQSLQHFVQHIELISKLRHPHLVSALGHCFECYLDDSTVSRIFLIFEYYVTNGSLRTWVSDGNNRRSLCWAQRISVSVGLAKGIQFLHTWIVPPIYSNNLNITDVLLDRNLVAKISSYNLPLLANNKVASGKSSGTKDPSSSARNEVEEKVDIYDFGVILLEMIFGKPLKYRNEVVVLNNLLKAVVADDDAGRRSAVDPAVQKACSNQSLKTMMEVCVRCLQREPGDRPSIDDVLWNLQFAAQVEDAWQESASSEGSPISPSGFRVAYI